VPSIMAGTRNRLGDDRMDRRRWASFLVVLVAASASMATTPAPPTPPPSADTGVTGTVELTADHPAAVRPITVRVTGLDVSSSGRTSVLLTATATRLPELENKAEVRLSIVRPEAGASTATVGPPGAFRSLLDSANPPRAVDLQCVKGACEGRFALIVDGIHLPAGNTVSVDWSVATHVEAWSGVPPGGKPALEVTVDNAPADPAKVAVTSAEAAGEPVRLDPTHRLAMWRVMLELGDQTLAEQPGWPLVALGRLRPTIEVVKSPGGAGGAPVSGMFIEGVGDQATNGLELRSRDEMEFEPFYSCVAADVCTADYTVGVVLNDARMDIAIDAGWTLDVQAIATDGHIVPVKVVATPIPPMPMISATIRGAWVTGSEGTSGPVGYKVTETLGGAAVDPQWHGLRTPTYGIWRARMTSTGTVPLPSDGFDVIVGPDDMYLQAKLDEDVVYGFTAGGPGCGRVPDCNLSDKLSGSLAFRTGTLQKGWQATVDWELELGMGTSASGGDAKLTIETVAAPTASP